MRFLLALTLTLTACGSATAGGKKAEGDKPQAAEKVPDGLEEAVFAAGCFWCLESALDPVPGVKEAVSGYTGGKTLRPTYYEVGSGSTGHTEAVRVVYDPKLVSYEELLQVFWHNVDPFDTTGQFCDRGSQYRPGVFPVDEAQRKAAEASKASAQETLGKPVLVPIEAHGTFWVAEDYHQDFWKTNPAHYQRYRTGCGRDRRLKAVWGEAAGH